VAFREDQKSQVSYFHHTHCPFLRNELMNLPEALGAVLGSLASLTKSLSFEGVCSLPVKIGCDCSLGSVLGTAACSFLEP